jgi:hypothetical protein
MRFFETQFLPEAEHFIAKLNPVIIRKILCTMDLAE